MFKNKNIIFVHNKNMKDKKTFNNELINFINNSTCSHTCIKYIKKILDKNNYVRLYEEEKWNLKYGKYYIIRNDASIIAFEIPKKYHKSFNIITTHLDTPSLLLKPNGAYIKDNYLKYNVMTYGGLLNYGWLDHPLSLAGRIIVNKNNKLIPKIIDFKKPMLIIPSVAIHLNDKANTNLDINAQLDLQPILGINKNKTSFENILKKKIKDKIIDYDLYAYNIVPPYFLGNNKELLISPRIDNLTSVYAQIQSFLSSINNNIKILCSFNSEEIGSGTSEGADSNFLIDNLKRIAASLNIDIISCLSSSFIISSDNTHAIHPNHNEKADDTNKAYLGKGVCIIKELESTTNSMSSSIIKTICNNNKIKYQDATSRNDLSTGSTLSAISLRHLSVLSIDIGISQLAMHSSYEVCSLSDIYELYKLMHFFYKTNIQKKKNDYIIKRS